MMASSSKLLNIWFQNLDRQYIRSYIDTGSCIACVPATVIACCSAKKIHSPNAVSPSVLNCGDNFCVLSQDGKIVDFFVLNIGQDLEGNVHPEGLPSPVQ